jgi:hypothetical protein
LTDLRHTTRIDGIAAALQAMGRSLEIRLAWFLYFPLSGELTGLN